jgi:hypothetical protein
MWNSEVPNIHENTNCFQWLSDWQESGRNTKLTEIYLTLTKSYIWRKTMTDKWQLTEQQLIELLLVSKVRLNVIKNDYTGDLTDETSTSTNTDRNQATAQSSQHDKTRC